MITRIQILAILASLFLMLLTVELIRRRQLEEKYALAWLLACIFFLLCSINLEIINFLARLTGIIVPANFLFLLAFFFLVVICLSLSVVMSRESQRQRRLAQELSLLKFNLEEIKKKIGLGGGGDEKGSS
ncbi:MAG TPA: DUF2304 domain-containing protein [Candidatus Hypogeohydataceae bacterium YC41]